MTQILTCQVGQYPTLWKFQGKTIKITTNLWLQVKPLQTEALVSKHIN